MCRICGRPMPVAGVCATCKRAPPPIDGIRSALVHENGARQAIHFFKYKNRPSLADPLAETLADAWRKDPLPIDIITAVPLHIARERERGYNQSNLLAKAFARQVDKPVSTDILTRVRHTRAQVGLSAADRQKNVRGAFTCRSEKPPMQPSASLDTTEDRQADAPLIPHQSPVQGKQVLVIDDVCTTGATLEACSLALKQAGATAVWGLTLARPAHPDGGSR